MDTYSWIRATIRAIFCLFGIFGNSWLAFNYIPRSLSHLKTNDMLFTNLAISNLISNYLVDIPEIIDFTSLFAKGKEYCGSFSFFSRLLETSSIYTTLFITTYWYQKLVGSLRHGGGQVQMDSIRLVAMLLAGTWTIAIGYSAPHFFFSHSENTTMYITTKECIENFHLKVSKQAYEFFYLTIVNIIPIIGIAAASLQIAFTLLQNEKRMRANNPAKVQHTSPEASSAHPAPTETPNKCNAVVTKPKAKSGSSSLVRAAKSVLAVATLFVCCWLTHLVVRFIMYIESCPVGTEIESYVGACYSSAIPYIYMYGLKKLPCSST